MRIAVSNIAWDVSEDDAVAALLHHYGVDAIDIAPGKYFPDPANARREDILNVKQWWAARGVEITGMQALLFGTSGLNVFGTAEVRDTLLTHLEGVCRIGGILGATRIVFGSPKNRDRSALDDTQTAAIAKAFFTRLGDIAQAHGVIICLEPNPTHYSANFMTTSAETAEVVRQLAHPAMRMQLDTGAMCINAEDTTSTLNACAEFIGHVHASERDLMPIGDLAALGSDHAGVGTWLARHLPEHIVTIEMLATKTEPHLISIERALKVVQQHYLQPILHPILHPTTSPKSETTT